MLFQKEEAVSERALEHREVVARVAVCVKGGDCEKCSMAHLCTRRISRLGRVA